MRSSAYESSYRPVESESSADAHAAAPTLARRVLVPTTAAALADMADRVWRTAKSGAADTAKLVERAFYGVPEAVRDIMRPPAPADGAVIIAGLPLHDEAATPASWRQCAPSRNDILLLLLSRCAGEPFGWAGQQDGRLLSNIVAAAGQEHTQTGASSTTALLPHTEDAFHPGRAHMLALAGIRNPDRVATTIAPVTRVRLSAAERQWLREPHAQIVPDASYGDDVTHRAPGVSTLWTDPASGLPSLRFDPAYTPLDHTPAEFRAAYEHLTAGLQRVQTTVAVAPGELLLIDNDAAVHGRVPFTPDYGGSGRWLKRVNIRIPGRSRNPSERTESGCGQRQVRPFASVVQ